MNKAADRVEIVVMVENWVDMLLGDDHEHPGGGCVTRYGLIDHFDPKRIPPQAENGISLLVKLEKGRHRSQILFDCGLTGSVLLHNYQALGEDLSDLDEIVISHGHPDHYGGLPILLDELDRPRPVTTHPEAFLPRHAAMGDGQVASFYNLGFQREPVTDAGGRLVETRSALDLGLGAFTTGEIPREVSFERPPEPSGLGGPGLYQVGADGHQVPDQVMDEQALVVEVRDQGLIVMTGCAHAGVVNTVQHAQALLGTDRVLAVIGGFHLGFPTTPSDNVARTVEALAAAEAATVMPMHCSGLSAHSSFVDRFAGRYVQPAVGTRLVFGR